MGNESFDGQALADKLSKLNNSQQSIESLSQWCISHRKKAKQIVETWEKLFNSSQKEQRISFLYLANDILQNSRRKGSEFVNEFWKVLPGALKHVYENGDAPGKKAVTRLVDIWEGRKVFGSRGKILKDEMLVKNSPPLSVSQVKSANPIKIVKRDAQSVRIKLAVGGLPEKIISAFESVFDEHLNEEAALNKCSTAIQCVGKIEEDFENSATQGNQLESGLQDELQEQENLLDQYIAKLETFEATRISLVLHLKEALHEQELKLAHIRKQLQDGRRRIEQARSVRKRASTVAPPPSNSAAETVAAAVSFAPLKVAAEEDANKAAAAAVAARLAASTSSAQMLTSVLSSFVAEEAASLNGGGGAGALAAMFSPDKRQKLSDDSGGAPGFFAPISGMQSTFAPPLPPPPPPPQQSQYVGAMGFVYGANTHPPPAPGPTGPPHFSMGMAGHNPPQMPQAQQQQPANGGFYRPPGMGFYGQSHQPATPPVHRQ